MHPFVRTLTDHRPAAAPKRLERCYACKREFSYPVAKSERHAGLCRRCHQSSLGVLDLLGDLAPRRFNGAYFARRDVDYPIPTPDRRCVQCGVIGCCHTWQHWQRREPSAGARQGSSWEGDGYVFCTNCRGLSVAPWSGAPLLVCLDAPQGSQTAFHFDKLAAGSLLFGVLLLIGLVIALLL